MLDSRQDLFFSGAATDAGERRPAPAEGFIYLLFFLNMSHSQMLGKFEYTLPAKF